MSQESVCNVLAALGCDPQRAPTWTVRCPMPNHGKRRDDREPSLSVKLDSRGLGLKCGAGCNTYAIIAYIGHDMRDLFFESTELPRPDPKELEAKYRRGELEPLLPHATRDNATRDIQQETYPSPMSLVHVSCCSLSADAKRVLADMLLLFGLFAAVGETRAMPYSTRFAAERMG